MESYECYKSTILGGIQFLWKKSLLNSSRIIMSLYYEAAQFLLANEGQSGSLKSRVFGSKAVKSAPKQIYALVAETSKWSEVLSGVINNAQLLRHERKVRASSKVSHASTNLFKHLHVAFTQPSFASCTRSSDFQIRRYSSSISSTADGSYKAQSSLEC